MSRLRAARLSVEPLERRDLLSGFPVQSFPLPSGTNFPDHLTVGGDGNVWYSCGLAHVVGYIKPDGTSKTFNTAGVSSHGMSGLTLGPDHNIWFVEFWDNKIGSLSPTGTIRQFKLNQNYGPQGIATGPDHNLWITTFDGYLGRVSPVTGGASWFKHNGEGVQKIVSWNGALYFQESDTIGRIETNGAFTGEFHLPHHGNLTDITVGPDGNLWFTEQHNNSTASDFVGYLTPAGGIREIPFAASNGDPGHITAAGDGNLYVRAGDYLEGLHTNGAVFASQYLEFIAGDGSVVQGPSGYVWYAEGVLGKIGEAMVTGTLAGEVFHDVDRDGMLEADGEAGLAGIKVWVDCNHDGKFDAGDKAAVTNAKGFFYFALPAGSWKVHVIPGNYHVTGNWTLNVSTTLATVSGNEDFFLV